MTISIGTKIRMCFTVLVCGYLATMTYGFWFGRQIEYQLYNVSESLFPATKLSEQALNAFNEQMKLYNDIVLMGDNTLIKSAKIKGNESIMALQQIVDLKGLNPKKIDDVQNLLYYISDFCSLAPDIYEVLSQNLEQMSDDDSKSKSKFEDVENKASRLAHQADYLKKRLLLLTQVFTDDLKNELLTISNTTKQQNYTNLLIFLLVVALALTLVSFIIDRFITRPLKYTVVMLRDIAEGQGDLTKRLEINRNDEVGELAKWFNSFVNNLQTMIRDIAQKAVMLTSSSADLSQLASYMSNGTNAMTTKSNSVASSAEQMSSNMNLIAMSAEQMTSTIDEIAKNSENARIITENAVVQSKSASGRVAALGEAARKIGRVTETITLISEQTNILALNATIEAARAGDSGKGFGVVANEIKELARQTAEATHDIKAKIESIQTNTKDTMTNITQISEIIDDVNKIVFTIAASVEQQSNTTKEIAGNVNESSSFSNKISQEIGDVNQSTIEISNCSAQLNLNAEKLDSLASQLKGMVEKFIV
ncbi:MAG: methyl-accepting chemotaxis protein [Desulfobacterales bacterium]|nr:methyl-accepting chemotaxis protein [Desulfobacterales bacterium]